MDHNDDLDEDLNEANEDHNDDLDNDLDNDDDLDDDLDNDMDDNDIDDIADVDNDIVDDDDDDSDIVDDDDEYHNYIVDDLDNNDDDDDDDGENHNDDLKDDDVEDEELEIITTPYQRASLLQTNSPWINKGVGFSSIQGTAIDNPTNLAQEIDLHEFAKIVCSAKNPNKVSMATTIPPPLVRLMQRIGDLKMVPHELVWDSQEKKEEGGKDRDGDYVKFATNPDFVAMKSLKKGYHALPGLAGDGYRISCRGRIHFPVVYYVWKGGYVIACYRHYMNHTRAKEYLDNGTGDILGRRTINSASKSKIRYRYFVRRYKVLDLFITKSQRRKFHGSDYRMINGVSMALDQGSAILTPFVGPRPEGYIVQHNHETWNNSLTSKSIEWMTASDNNRCENQKPK
jgi:hypothetical protein